MIKLAQENQVNMSNKTGVAPVFKSQGGAIVKYDCYTQFINDIPNPASVVEKTWEISEEYFLLISHIKG